MRLFILFIALSGLLISCDSVEEAAFGDPVATSRSTQNLTPEQQVVTRQGWSGNYALCGKNTDFNRNSTIRLPSFSNTERFGFCARTVRYLKLHRQYGHQTDFFGIIATNTAILAAIDAPLIRNAYSDQSWAFLARAGDDLEVLVNRAADSFAAGNVISLDTLIARDQRALQSLLNNLEDSDIAAYKTVAKDITRSLNPVNALVMAAVNSNPFYKAYMASLARARDQSGGRIKFGNIQHRLFVAQSLQILVATHI